MSAPVSGEGSAVADRRAQLLPLGVALVVLLVALANITPHLIGVFFDDAIYALVAKAIAEGQGFVYPQLPGTPPAIHYPPAFPLLLALVWKIAPPFPESTMWFKVVNPLVLSIAAWGAMRLAMRVLGWSPLAAAGVVLLGFVSVPTLVLTSVLLSEPLFLAILFPALLVASLLVEEGGLKWAAVAGVVSAALILTRTVGGVMVPAVVLVLLWDRRWREAALYSAVTVALVMPWQLFVWKHAPGFPDPLRGSYGPYLEWVIGGYREGGSELLFGVIRKNLEDAWGSLGLFFSPLIRSVRPAAAVVVIAASIGGILAGLVERRTRVVALTTGAYLCVVFAWPYQIERFLWGAWPLLLLLAGFGLVRACVAVRARPAWRWGVMAVAAFLVIGHATYNGRGLAKGWAGSASRRMSERMLPVVRFAVGEPRLRGKLWASDVAPMLALYTGEQVISLDILMVRNHLVPKSVDELAAVIVELDRTFEPEAYVLLSDAQLSIIPAFLRAERDPARHFREFTATGLGVRAFLLDPR